MTRPTKMSKKQALMATDKILAANGIDKVPDAYILGLLLAREEDGTPRYFPLAPIMGPKGKGYAIVDDGHFEARLLHALEAEPYVSKRARVDSSSILKPRFNP